MKWIELTDLKGGKHYCNTAFITKVWVRDHVTCVNGLGNNGWGEYSESYDEIIKMIKE